jgi:hypothetical protein
MEAVPVWVGKVLAKATAALAVTASRIDDLYTRGSARLISVNVSLIVWNLVSIKFPF